LLYIAMLPFSARSFRRLKRETEEAAGTPATES